MDLPVQGRNSVILTLRDLTFFSSVALLSVMMVMTALNRLHTSVLNTDNLTEVALHSQRPNAMIEEDFSTEIVIETKNETDDNHDHKELISQVDPIESATIDSCSLVLSVWQFLLFLALVVICYCLRRRRLKSHPITPITAVENTLAAELLKINGLLENSRLKIAEMLRRYPEYRNPVTNGHCCND